MLYTGSDIRRIDDKGRVALPPRFRVTGMDKFVPMLSSDRPCVILLSPEQWEQAKLKLESDEHALRIFLAASEDAKVDNQWRIPLRPQFQDHLTLADGDVLFAGVGDVIELWDPEIYRKYCTAKAR